MAVAQGELFLLDEHHRVTHAQARVSTLLARKVERIVRLFWVNAGDSTQPEVVITDNDLRYHVFTLRGEQGACFCVYVERAHIPPIS